MNEGARRRANVPGLTINSDKESTMTNGSTKLPARFWAKVNKNGPDGTHSQTGENLGPCWLWEGTRACTGGYGQTRLGTPGGEKRIGASGGL